MTTSRAVISTPALVATPTPAAPIQTTAAPTRPVTYQADHSTSHEAATSTPTVSLDATPAPGAPNRPVTYQADHSTSHEAATSTPTVSLGATPTPGAPNQTTASTRPVQANHSTDATTTQDTSQKTDSTSGSSVAIVSYGILFLGLLLQVSAN